MTWNFGQTLKESEGLHMGIKWRVCVKAVRGHKHKIIKNGFKMVIAIFCSCYGFQGSLSTFLMDNSGHSVRTYREAENSNPSSCRRSTYSVRLYDFSIAITKCYKDVYSFFPHRARLWNSLPAECFHLTYDLNGLKTYNSFSIYFSSFFFFLFLYLHSF